jgi:hypothetical protein
MCVTMDARHAAWGALEPGTGTAPEEEFPAGELVALRGQEVLLAWGPALGDLGLLQKAVEQVWSERAVKNPFVARAVFHADYAAAFVDKPHGLVFSEAHKTLETAGATQPEALKTLGVEWVDEGEHLRFQFKGGTCGEVSADEGSARYWIARSPDHEPHAKGTFALVDGAEPTQLGSRGMKDVFSRN